jgi:hypothetical protein
MTGLYMIGVLLGLILFVYLGIALLAGEKLE